MAPNAQMPVEKLAAIFTGLKNRNADVRVQNAKELRRFVSSIPTLDNMSI
jgi:FKBP12-rapamycin complex-associated protein